MLLLKNHYLALKNSFKGPEILYTYLGMNPGTVIIMVLLIHPHIIQLTAVVASSSIIGQNVWCPVWICDKNLFLYSPLQYMKLSFLVHLETYLSCHLFRMVTYHNSHQLVLPLIYLQLFLQGSHAS